MSSNAGGGSVTLPVDYVREHVRLGYAATEHGNQGDTTTVGVELVSEATTRRGLYVGSTRGREENLILVITESHDLDEARDILERVLTNERADLPAIAQRRLLAREARPAAPPSPSRPRFRPRCEIPTWVGGLMAAIGDELGRAHDTNRHYDNRRDELTAELRKAEQHRDHAERILDRHHPSRAAADREVRQAQQQVWSTNAELRHSKGLKRRRLRHQVGEASDDLAAAQQRQQNVEEATLPDTKLFRDADLEVRKLMMQLRDVEGERRTALGADGTDGLTRVRDALFHWRCWAEGRPVPPDVIVDTVEALRDQRMIKSAYAETLLKPLEIWCESHGIQPQRPVIQPAPVECAPDLGIGL